MELTTLTSFLNYSYPYGFSTKFSTPCPILGLSETLITVIAKKKQEPIFSLVLRLHAYTFWQTMSFPLWANLSLTKRTIAYHLINYYTEPIPNTKKNTELFTILFKKLGIDVEETLTPQVAVDLILDSSSIKTTYQAVLLKLGIIFCSMSDALKYYSNLVQKFLGAVVPLHDNFFATLNTAVFSDGSFCYIPQNTICPLDLSTYFRINTTQSGQFERTLIIAEKGSKLQYFEGCTATSSHSAQLHAAVVELICFEKAHITYTTFQNWYLGTDSGKGGILNLVTKRGLAIGQAAQITWLQIEIGSAITWKYPSCILLGKATLGKFYSITVTKHYQETDTGTKMLHLGEETESKIFVKTISTDYSKNSYRGLVQINEFAHYARNFSQCDSYLLGNTSLACTYPYLFVSNLTAKVEHEAKIEKLNYEYIFYLMQRGVSMAHAINLILIGFCKEILNSLPLEYAKEIETLLLTSSI